VIYSECRVADELNLRKHIWGDGAKQR